MLPQHPSGLRVLVCWVAIVASAVAVAAAVQNAKASPRDPASVRPAAQELVSGRYAVGAMNVDAVRSSAGTGEQLIRPLREAADTPARQLRLAILLAELRGPADAEAALPPVPSAAPAPPLDASPESAVEAAAGVDVNESPEAKPDIAADAALVRRILADGTAAALTDAQRAQLTDNHGWFGRLALAFGAPATDPARREVIGDARRTFALMLGVGVVLLVVLLSGVLLLVVGVVLLLTKSLRFPTAPDPADWSGVPHVLLLEAFAIYLVVLAGSMLWGQLGLPGGRWVGTPLMLAATIGLLFWPALRGGGGGVTLGQSMRAIGLHGGPRGWLGEALFGVVGYVALLPLVAAAFALTVFLTRTASADAAHPVVDGLTGPPIVLVILFLLAVVWAPVTEEVFFRGMFFGHARRLMPWPIAAAAVGVIFAMMHPQGWTAIPLLATIGFNFAVLRQWRGGSLVAPIAAHALNNGTVLTLGVLLLR